MNQNVTIHHATTNENLNCCYEALIFSYQCPESMEVRSLTHCVFFGTTEPASCKYSLFAVKFNPSVLGHGCWLQWVCADQGFISKNWGRWNLDTTLKDETMVPFLFLEWIHFNASTHIDFLFGYFWCGHGTPGTWLKATAPLQRLLLGLIDRYV